MVLRRKGEVFRWLFRTHFKDRVVNSGKGGKMLIKIKNCLFRM